MLLTVCIKIHPQPHVHVAFPHLWAIINRKVILLGTLDGQKLWKIKNAEEQCRQLVI